MRVSLKAFQTSTFRLTAIYLFLFIASIAAVLSYVYYNTVVILQSENEETISAEVTGIADQYRVQGVSGIAQTIQRRLAENSESFYLLTSPANQFIVGNIKSVEIKDLPDQTWIDFHVKEQDQPNSLGHPVRAYFLRLPSGFQLLVGRDVEDLEQFSNLIRNSLGWALGIALALGLGGGFLLSRNVMRRVDAITETTETIMSGDLSGRMPISGAGDELDRLSASLNAMLNQIESLMQGLREVSSNVAHDLKTPLTRMRVRVEDALRQDNIADHRDALKQTVAECDNLLSTFNALLSIAQLEAGQQRASLEVLDAHDILHDVAELYGPLAEDNGGAVALQATPGLNVRAKRELLAQAVNNLIDNAMKYGEAQGKGADISVTGERNGKSVIIAVSDRGQGIPEKDRERVLKRFVRLDESRSKPGNGLGLSLVASLANMLGGKLVLEDNKPGLRAELRLPLAQG